jgi:hypothetical protein
MTDKEVITPFELGVLSALTAIGVSLASADIANRTKLIDLANALKSKLPTEPKYKGGGPIHHAPLEALITGLSPARSDKSAD